MLLRPVGRLWLAASFVLVPVVLSAQGAAENVDVQMRHVDFHVDSTTVMHINYLRGELRPTSPGHAPYFDDKNSFVLSIDSAQIRITARDLSNLLNRYTFAYPGSPLKKLRISIENGRLKQEGEMHGISFSMVGDLTLTPDGELRLHPSSIKTVGLGVGGLMKFFGLHLEKLVKLKGARGVRIDKDDFLLSPTELLPPPLVKGRVGWLEVSDSGITQVFQPPAGAEVRALTVPDSKAANYMFYRGGVLRFGKLTMHDTDLMIVDPEPGDPFDFFLDQYQAQLVAGYSRITPDGGLIAVMQDYKRTPPLPTRTASHSTEKDSKK